MTTFTEQLQAMNACQDAIDWVNGRSLRKCWQVANRADWMLWLVDKLGICETEQHELACDFAERVLKYVPVGEDRPRIAIETKRRWIKGEATDEELAAARDAAWSARAATWATWAAWAARAAARSAWAASNNAARSADAAEDAAGAAWAASNNAARSAGSAEDAAGAAEDSVMASAWAAWAAEDAAMAAGAAERKAQCRLIRKHIPVEMVEEAMQ